jgi:hypothetical protein
MAGRKRGRPSDSYAKALKARTQYTWARERTGLNDSQLDAKYSGKAQGQARDSADRTYDFSNAKYPYKGRPLPQDVVLALETDPATQGILHITRSVFWKILAEPAETCAKATAQVKMCLRPLGLIRLPLLHEERWVAMVRQRSVKERLVDVERFDESSDIARVRLEQLIAQYPRNLDIVALLAALYLEAHFSFEPACAEWLGIRFWTCLQYFLSQDGLRAMEGVLDEYAVNRIVYGRSERESRKAFNPRSSHRLPGHGIGVLLPKDDPLVREVLQKA